MRCLPAIDCVGQESDKSANFIDKCEKTDRTEPWNLKLFQLNKISCFGVAYYNPPSKIRKGNDQKKYTLEVKTVKARKSDGLV